MRKVVMVASILVAVLVIVLGALVWLKPVPEKIPLSPEEVYGVCVEETRLAAGLVKAVSTGIEQCKTVKDDLFKEYCRAWFKEENACLSLNENERPACLAILKRELEQCGDNEFCYGIIGKAEDCEKFTNSISKMICAALARRDRLAFEQGIGCVAEKENFESQTKCLAAAKSIEEVEKCEKPATT